MDTSKTDTGALSVTTTTTTTETRVYERAFLESQLLRIVKQRDDFVLAQNASLDQINVLIAECDRLGILT